MGSRFDDQRNTIQSIENTEQVSPANFETENKKSSKQNKAEGSSIAVLPFINMSADKDQEYFTDGISEEILNVLAQIPNLHVTSRSSAFSFKGKEINLSEVAKQLGVKNILEGSVRKSGTTIRITAQLIEAETDKHLWSQTYDRELVDIFKIQDEISAAIVASLKNELGLNVKAIKREMDEVDQLAHSEYLKGRFFIEKRNFEDVTKAKHHFKKATELAPNFAPGWMGLAWSEVFLSETNYGNQLPQDAFKLGIVSAQKALALDPNLPEAHAIMSLVLNEDNQYALAQTHLKRAIEINPNYADAYTWLANAINEEPNWIVNHAPQEGLDLSEKALQLNPLSIIVNLNNVESLIALGETQKALKIAKQMQVIDNNHPLTPLTLAIIQNGSGEHGKGLNNWMKALKLNPNSSRWKLVIATGFDRIGMRQKSLNILDDSNRKIFTPWFKGDLKGLIKIIRKNFPRTDKDNFGNFQRGLVEVIAEDYSAAIEFLLKSNLCQLCDSLIYSYQQIGETEKANNILEERKTRYEKLLKAGVKIWIYNETNYSGRTKIEIVGMNISYFSGDIEDAISLLEEAVSVGYIIQRKYKILPMYSKLRSHPKWNALLAESDQHTAKERRIFADLENNG